MTNLKFINRQIIIVFFTYACVKWEWHTIDEGGAYAGWSVGAREGISYQSLDVLQDLCILALLEHLRHVLHQYSVTVCGCEGVRCV